MSQNNLRIVLDANVIVSASLDEHSTSAKAFHKATDEGSVYISKPTLREIRDVIRRDKFDRYVSKQLREKFLRALVRDT